MTPISIYFIRKCEICSVKSFVHTFILKSFREIIGLMGVKQLLNASLLYEFGPLCSDTIIIIHFTFYNSKKSVNLFDSPLKIIFLLNQRINLRFFSLHTHSLKIIVGSRRTNGQHPLHVTQIRAHNSPSWIAFGSPLEVSCNRVAIFCPSKNKFYFQFTKKKVFIIDTCRSKLNILL